MKVNNLSDIDYSFKRIYDKIMKVVEEVLEDFDIDYKNWWKYDFETEIFVSNKEELKDLSNNDLEILKMDWICSIINNLVSNVCEKLSIDISNDSILLEDIYEVVRSKLLLEIDDKIEVNFPYHIGINNQNDAKRVIFHLCDECDRRYDCSGANSSKCNKLKEKIVRKFFN